MERASATGQADLLDDRLEPAVALQGIESWVDVQRDHVEGAILDGLLHLRRAWPRSESGRRRAGIARLASSSMNPST